MRDSNPSHTLCRCATLARHTVLIEHPSISDKLLSLSVNKRYLVFVMLNEAVTSAKSATSVKILLSDHLLPVLIKSISDKTNLCHVVANKVVS